MHAAALSMLGPVQMEDLWLKPTYVQRVNAAAQNPGLVHWCSLQLLKRSETGPCRPGPTRLLIQLTHWWGFLPWWLWDQLSFAVSALHDPSHHSFREANRPRIAWGSWHITENAMGRKGQHEDKWSGIIACYIVIVPLFHLEQLQRSLAKSQLGFGQKRRWWRVVLAMSRTSPAALELQRSVVRMPGMYTWLYMIVF